MAQLRRTVYNAQLCQTLIVNLLVTGLHSWHLTSKKPHTECLLQVRQLLESAVMRADRTVKSEASAPVTVENPH